MLLPKLEGLDLATHKKAAATRDLLLYFHTLNMNFITKLLVSGGCNAIFTFSDKLIKFTRLIPCYIGGKALALAEVV